MECPDSSIFHNSGNLNIIDVIQTPLPPLPPPPRTNCFIEKFVSRLVTRVQASALLIHLHFRSDHFPPHQNVRR